MKKIQKIFILFTMLFTGLSFKAANNVEKNVVADAAELAPGSYAYLKGYNALEGDDPVLGSWWGSMTSILSSNGYEITDSAAVLQNFKTILITNKGLPENRDYLPGCPVDVGLIAAEYAPTNYTDGCAVAAYISKNENDATKLDLIFYAEVETIYPADGNYLFSGLTNVETITFDCKFSISKAKGMTRMFSGCESLTELDVSNVDTSEVTTMDYTFTNCNSLTTIVGLNEWDTSQVTNMRFMFTNCDTIKELDISNFNISKVTTIQRMFMSCDSLTVIKGLENLNTSSVTNLDYMLGYCPNLTTLDLSNFDLSSVSRTEVLLLLSGCTGLIEIKTPNNLADHSIKLPSGFYASNIDSSLQGVTLIRGSKELNDLVGTLRSLKTCEAYMQGPELQIIYDGLSEEDKDTFAKLTDNDGVVLLSDKLAYMVLYADYKTNNPDQTKTHLAISPRTSQYLVIVIACLSLSMICGYYFIQKKKYAK